MKVFWVKILRTVEHIKKYSCYNQKTLGLLFHTFQMLICTFTSLHTFQLVNIKLNDCFIQETKKTSDHPQE
jgi:hypothetical protein